MNRLPLSERWSASAKCCGICCRTGGTSAARRLTSRISPPLLGEHAVIASRIGKEQLDEELLYDLRQRGIDVGYMQRDVNLPTGTAQVSVSPDGQPAFEIRQPSAWDALEWSTEWERLARQANAVCFGTLAQRSELSRATINTFLKATRPDCVRVFDVNLRPPFSSRDLIVNSMRLATIAKLNEEEFVEVCGMMGLPARNLPEDARSFARSMDLELVCLTRGRSGSLLATPQEIAEHPGFAVQVADTVGAGDAFTAAVAGCWISHLGLDKTNVMANRWAAWVASQHGAMPAIHEDLRQKMLS